MNSTDVDTVSFFANREYQKIAIIAIFAALIVAEKYFAHRKNDQSTVRRSYAVNFGMLVFNDILLSVLSVSSLLAVAENFSGFGLFSRIPNMPVKAIISFVLLDFTLYCWHLARHRYLILWQFHKVHHSDIVMNTTTTFRLHFVEVFLTVIVKSLFIMVVGVPVAIVLASEMFITMVVMFNHTNISFPCEKLLGKVLITPRKHVVHHSTLGAEQHSNFGFAFSIWDKLFGTCQKTVPETLGLRNTEEQGFWDALWLRFLKS